MRNIFEEIVITNKFVIQNAKYVSIKDENIKEFATKIDKIKVNNWLETSSYDLLNENIEDIINFLLYFEAIDFSFWGDPKWSIETNEGIKDGSIALMYAMLGYFRKNKNFINMNKEEFRELLKGNIEIPLFEERWKIIKYVNNVISKEMDGNFYRKIYNLKTDIELINFIISNFKNFKDERIYRKRKIYFYKLAQLLTSDILHMREKKEKIKVDYTNLIGCSDYKIPQVLRALNLIEYNLELANLVDNKIEIKENSEYEVEIRASVIYVINQIKQLTNNINSIDINDYIWLMGRDKKLIKKPYHLTRSTNY